MPPTHSLATLADVKRGLGLNRAVSWWTRLRPEREERIRTRYFLFALLERNLPRAEETSGPGKNEADFH